jgi:tetratricopeptide (TPR) repeat protein
MVESPSRPVPCAEPPLVARPGLGPLRSAHHAADQAASAADKRRAIELLRRAVEPIAPAGEGLRFAYQDGWARIAQLAIELDDLKVAEEAIAQGLSAGKAASVPVATLLELRGTVHERQGQKQAAIAAYHDALLVNQELMQRSLSAAGAGEQ